MLELVKSPPLVKIEGLTKKFGLVAALNDINLEIGRGHIIGLLGPNGFGKTTLLKILAGLYANYQGLVTIDSHKPSHITKAFVSFQADKSLLPVGMTVNEVIEIYKNFFTDFREELCRDMLTQFTIDPNKKFKEMSKGTIDKIQIALTMARKASLYLLDEPLGGVDVKARSHVLDTILNSYDSDASIIVATHLISQIEPIFDQAILLDRGRLDFFGDCDELRDKRGLTLEETI